MRIKGIAQKTIEAVSSSLSSILNWEMRGSIYLRAIDLIDLEIVCAP